MSHNLRKCWHPVCYAEQLVSSPLATTLLGEAVVLWRDSRGEPHAFRDLCIHRGTALSLGSVRGDELVCAYHGWRYCSSGACTLVPQLADQAQIPRKARVDRFGCRELYGIVWVALEQPAWPVPDVPELLEDNWRVVRTGPFRWKAGASRQIENFTDLAHFPFVHPGLLGDPDRTQVPEHTVQTEGHVLYYEIVRPEATNTKDFPVFANQNEARPERKSRYQLHLPYTIVLRLGWGATQGMVYFFASQPVSDHECVGYCIIARNYNLEQPDEVLQRFEDVIFGQDQRIVESQRPDQVPFDLSAELHLRSDAVAVAYRRAMGAFGLD